jgi:hypothetical protein
MNSIAKIRWMKSLQNTSAKWRRRNRIERIALLEAFLLLGMARLGVMVLPFRWLAKSLGKHMTEAATPIQTDDLHLARMVGRAVRSAASYTPWGSVCLPQAVAAKWMLRRRHIAGTVYLGVMKDDTKPEKLAAHAWIRCGSVIVIGAEGHHQYTVVSTFS